MTTSTVRNLVLGTVTAITLAMPAVSFAEVASTTRAHSPASAHASKMNPKQSSRDTQAAKGSHQKVSHPHKTQ